MGHLDKCRVCSSDVARDDEAYNLLHHPYLAVKFSECTNLVVDPDDQDILPSEICSECYELLEKFHSFRALCIIADNKWRSKSLVTWKKIDRRKPVYEVDEDEEEELELEELLLEPPEMIICDTNLSAQNTAKVAEQATPTLVFHTFTENVQQPPETEKKALEGHMLYHCTEPGCEEAFTRFENLLQHELEHSEVGMRFVCEEEGCNRITRRTTLAAFEDPYVRVLWSGVQTGSALSQHRFTHGDQLVLPYACELPDCSMRFYSTEKLKIHMMRHQGIKNFSCPYCGLKKTTKNELRLHINYHTLERTWSCKDCPKVCNSSTSLKKHIRAIHEKARDYACSYCEKKFATPDTRKYHEMTHTGEKNFECHVCGKKFIQPSALRTHRKVHESGDNQQTACALLQLTSMG
ncbi:GD13125 [Drosophila simulans]|uniref:GD13125 n=1 Tax=Drosophila simulans TaxID=7240 RepID=B4QJE4_DROSI|nr:GD13125 [Drosophila simulans]